MSYKLPSLDYDYNALEPHFDAQTMEIHHSKHHATYISKVNAALQDSGIAYDCVCELVSKLSEVPESIRGAVRNNGGGHANHSFFWQNISPDGGGNPEGTLGDSITETFGSFDAFKSQFATAGVNRFGSGWVWLIVTSEKKLAITSTANQDSPWMTGVVATTGTPLIGLDVWEHAYYLKYQNKRPDYIEAFWKVVDWKFASKRFTEAIA